MKVSKEEVMHIAKLANLNLRDEEIDKFTTNLEDILNFADIVNNAPVEGLTESFGVNENYNVFRKDEIKVFEDNEALLQNAPEKDRNMFKIPKVIQ
ncbi:MAG: Asp-tRNA(Asn)/Glu-tRNA(Gln) amidotransferase subunit GatC [Clostridia bacterium]|nr:Asp-tRNA(Asn)/Glu-tRNA(Gln) amidotransferase subunit GatC [Clostridia bacterium]